MKRFHLALAGLVLAFSSAVSSAQETINDVLSDPVLDLSRPADRALAVQRMRVIENANLERARAKANAMGIPMRQVLPDGTVTEIMGLDENGEFLINRIRNANAAISSAVNFVYPIP